MQILCRISHQLLEWKSQLVYCEVKIDLFFCKFSALPKENWNVLDIACFDSKYPVKNT